jgi:hypothetical protein
MGWGTRGHSPYSTSIPANIGPEADEAALLEIILCLGAC